MHAQFMSLLILLLVSASFWGCTKEVETQLVETNVFMRVYPELGTQTCTYMKATEDGGCFLFVNEDLRAFGDGKKLAVIKLDAKGKIEWKNLIDNYELPSLTVCTALPDGSLLFTKDGTAGIFVKINKSGTIDFVSDYSHIFPKDNTYNGGYVQLGPDGLYRQAFCNGFATWSASAYVATFNPDGTFIGTIPISEASFGVKNFKLTGLSLYKYGNGTTHFFVGTCFLHDKYSFSWSERNKIFVNKMVLLGDSALVYSKTLIIDTLPDNNAYTSWFHRYTNDRHVIIASTVKDNRGIFHGQLTKINDNLEIVWKTNIAVSNYGTSLGQSIEFTRDGNIFITGTCQVPGKISSQPFAAKISNDGNLMWYKVFQTNLNSSMSYGLETINGDYILSGITTGFGSGNTGADLFIMKTDKNMNYQE